MKILTDTSFVTAAPLSLVPVFAAYYTGFDFFRGLNWVDPLNKKAFRDGRFNGIDLNLTISGSGLFRGESNVLSWRVLHTLKKLKRNGRDIFAFHGGHEYRNNRL